MINQKTAPYAAFVTGVSRGKLVDGIMIASAGFTTGQMYLVNGSQTAH